MVAEPKPISDMCMVAQAANAEQALAEFRRFQPDITLTDLRVAGTALIAIRGEFPQARIIMLSSSEGLFCYRALPASLLSPVPDHATRVPRVVKHIWIGRLLCFMSLLVSTSLFGLDNDHIPLGSYRKSCTDIKMRDGSLRARCRDLQGDWIKTELYDSSRCPGDIANLNGQLHCDDSTPPSAGPQESLSVSVGDWERTIGQTLDPEKAITHFIHTAWTEEQGAPSNIHAIAQTTNGYLWLGTLNSLYYFDGVRFTQFVPPVGEEFPATRIGNLLATHDGSLWIRFISGEVSRLRSGHLSSFSGREGLPGALSMAEDRDGTLVAGTVKGLARFWDGIWTDVTKKWNFPGKLAKKVYFDMAGTLWVLTEDRIVYLPSGQHEFVDPGEIAGNAANFAEAPDGTIWISEVGRSAHTVRRTGNGPVTEVRVGASWVLFDRHGSLWISSVGDGIRRIPHPEGISGRQIARFGPEAEQFTAKNGLSGDYVHSLFEDREGNIWSVGNVGLDRFRESAFTPVSIPHPDIPRGILATSDGALWTFTVNPLEILRIGPRDDQKAVSRSMSIGSMFEDERGALWLAAARGEIYRFQSGRIIKVFDSKHALSGGVFLKDAIGITRDREGGIWLLDAQKGLLRVANDAITKIAEPACPGQPGYLYTDRRDRVWVGQCNQVAVYDGGKSQTFGTGEGVPPGLVFRPYQDRAGNVWAGGDGGLSKFEKERFRPLSRPNGLPAKSVFGMAEDGDGYWWIATDAGVLRIPGGELDRAVADQTYRVRYQSFDVLDGLPGKPREGFPMPVVARTTDGRIWFATAKGIAFLDPHRIPKNPLPPPVVLEAIRADGKQIARADGLAFPHSVTDIEIDYTALSLAIPERVLFRYKLEGSDTDWHDAGTRRQAFYNHLAPKQYRFRVIACNNDGVWNETGTTFDFLVLPAWYQTNWFRALCGVGFLALLWGTYQLRVQQLERQFAIGLEARVNERTRIARDLHDTLLQSFQGLMLRFQLVEDLLPEGKAKTQLEQTLQRADQAIAEGRRAVYDLRSSTAVPTDLAQTFRSLGDEFATENSATFHLVVEGEARDLNPMIRDELYFITREALRNAFSHARAQQIEAEITYGERAFRLRIRDDGEGIPTQILEEGRPGHYGLSGMRERAKQISGKLELWSRAGAGTEIDLSIPGSVAYRASVARPLFSLFSLLGRKAE